MNRPTINNNQQARSDYIKALLDPEYAVNNGVDTRIPSDVRLPTNVLNLKNHWLVTPNALGNAFITWRPNFLATPAHFDDYIKTVTKGQYAQAYDSFLTKNDQGDLWQRVFNFQGTTEDVDFQYSQVTINTDDLLDGQATAPSDFFQPMVKVNSPVLKYRLVSAKMKITYIGQADQTSGVIVSGSYLSKLAPVAWANAVGMFDTPTLNTSGGRAYDQWYTKNLTRPVEAVKDMSAEIARFHEFDNIYNLPSGNRQVIVRNKPYEFFYYPTDPLSNTFTAVNNYGLEETMTPVGYLDLVTSANSKICFGTKYQDGITYIYSPIDVWNDNSSNHPMITNPTYFIALEGLNNAGNNSVMIELFENYEVTIDQGLAMIAYQEPKLILPKDVIDSIRKETLNNMNKKKTQVNNEIEKSVNRVVRRRPDFIELEEDIGSTARKPKAKALDSIKQGLTKLGKVAKKAIAKQLLSAAGNQFKSMFTNWIKNKAFGRLAGKAGYALLGQK